MRNSLGRDHDIVRLRLPVVESPRAQRDNAKVTLWISIALGLAILVTLCAASKAGAQDATPIVSDESPGEGLPIFGFTVLCPDGMVTVQTEEPFHGTHTEECYGPDSQIMKVVFTCGEGLSTGMVQAWQKGDFTDFFEARVVISCQYGPPDTWDQKPCVSYSGTAYVNTPVYGERHAEVFCHSNV